MRHLIRVRSTAGQLATQTHHRASQAHRLNSEHLHKDITRPTSHPNYPQQAILLHPQQPSPSLPRPNTPSLSSHLASPANHSHERKPTSRTSTRAANKPPRPTPDSAVRMSCGVSGRVLPFMRYVHAGPPGCMGPLSKGQGPSSRRAGRRSDQRPPVILSGCAV